MSTELLQQLVRIARSEIGVRESGNNAGDRVIQYQRATWLPPGPWPWCAAFTAWCLREWVRIPDVRAALSLSDSVAAEQWRCRDARAFGWEEWASKRGLQVLPDTQVPRVGDLVTFDFSHIGLVVDVPKVGNTFQSIEGNTNGAGSRDGDGVYLKTRTRNLARAYIRLLP